MKLLHNSVYGTLLALGVMSSTAQAYYAYNFSTFAGTVQVSGSANGTGTGASFDNPFALAVDAGGNIYVADTLNSTIRKVTPAGVVSTFAGTAMSSGSSDSPGALFSDPQGVAVDSSGNVYVADTFNCTIRKITAGGTVSTFAGTATVSGSNDSPNAHFKNPAGVAVDTSGNVYVADTGNNTIRKITPGGVVSTFAGTAGAPGDGDGTGVSVGFNAPQALTVDAAGNVYVADTFNFTIRKITSGGSVSTLAGSAGVSGSTDASGTSASFLLPQGITVDGSGNLFVSDSGNNTIRKVTPAGMVSTIGGTAAVTGNTPGTWFEAQFSLPEGIALNSAGVLYIADVRNDVIRKGRIIDVESDFNVDANPDIFWQNTSTGLTGVAGMIGTTFDAWISLGILPVEWELAGSGDFDGDGQTDLVFQNTTTGASGIYLMNGNNFVTWVDFNTTGTAWRIAGVGDFNGDGIPDIIYRNPSTGAAGVYLMNGTALGTWVNFGVLPNVWQIAGTGDFDGDGNTDIVWQNTATGDSGVFLMNGTSFGTWVDLHTHGTPWKAMGTGDYNGDGSVDILWQNPNTQDCGVFLMNGTDFGSWQFIETAGAGWTIRQ